MAQRAESELRAVEARDPRHASLSTLPNRHALRERLAIEVHRSHRYMHPLSLCLLDLDGLRTLEEDSSSAARDDARHTIAGILDECRGADDCYRIGDEEFAVVMPEATRKEAGIAATRIAARARGVPSSGSIEISFGVAGITDADPESLIKAAARELAIAKTQLDHN